MVYLKGGTLTNTTDIYYSEVIGYGATMSGTTENNGYLTMPFTYSFSKNHDGTPGAFKAWSGGGYVIDDTTIKPIGLNLSYKHICESATYPCIRQETVQVESKAVLKVRGYFKLNAEFVLARPTLELLALDGTTVLDTSGLDISSLDTTNWQQTNLEWTNTADYTQTVVIRASAKLGAGAENYLNEVWKVIPESSGGGYRSRYRN
jgi:hypothetical protein